jgi:hypothetical protein
MIRKKQVKRKLKNEDFYTRQDCRKLTTTILRRRIADKKRSQRNYLCDLCVFFGFFVVSKSPLKTDNDNQSVKQTSL